VYAGSSPASSNSQYAEVDVEIVDSIFSSWTWFGIPLPKLEVILMIPVGCSITASLFILLFYLMDKSNFLVYFTRFDAYMISCFLPVKNFYLRVKDHPVIQKFLATVIKYYQIVKRRLIFIQKWWEDFSKYS
jgi:hypothetical protein